ncbi:benzaldehyde dehydrogenase (NAD) [Variovorax sp. YR752]|uniref:aldehyde dehydrogenase n=1 Tax=Variovorax sp. YR752 TaxID=1884383 RepID=UPI000BC92D1D|nr:aldehyde dehydrogenase [Variovorax sp. YR752]SOE06169.1 benzaldehyde dehydrogenase (NAD) [Variovorax sp. YR752]
MHIVQLQIQGELAPARSGATFQRCNPITQEVVTTAAAAGPEDAVAAVVAAQRAFPAWARTGPAERRSILTKAADELERNLPTLITTMMSETGASELWAGFNATTAVGILREAAALTTQISGEVIPSDVPGNLALAVRQPAGVCLGIAPWNAPLILGVRAIAVPLACANTVILKASEACPATHRCIVDAFSRAGVAPGVVNFVSNAPADAEAVVDAMISHPAVRRINFTGSTKVGKIIAVKCAAHLKPVVLELGGKAPLVVLDDADLDQAVDGAIFGAFLNSGQICMSTERIIVDESIADEFVERLASKARALAPGPAGSAAALGSVVDMATVERCNMLLDDALAAGARLLCGGRADTTLMAPTLLDHVQPGMKIYGEESFGPIKGIVRVKGVEEAVRCANDNEYGLSAAVYGRDIARALQVAQRIESGICHINGPTVHDEPQMPFGGVKASGVGRFGGHAGIDAFTDLRWLTVQTSARHYPF